MTTASVLGVDVPPSGTYLLDPVTSSIGFTTHHMFGTGKVTGTFGLAGGEIIVAEPVERSSVTASSPTYTFSTGHAKRDAKVLSAAFLDVDVHPFISFTSTGLTNVDGLWVLRGEITAHGIKAPVELTVNEASATASGLRLRASGRVDRYDHGITKMRGMAGRYLDIDISAVATRS